MMMPAQVVYGNGVANMGRAPSRHIRNGEAHGVVARMIVGVVRVFLG